jgi:flagellar export protein FliJ
MAKKFKFRLDPLLRLKSHKVERAKEMLSEVSQMRFMKEDEKEKNLAYLKEMLNTGKKSGNVLEMQAASYHNAYVRSQIEKLQKEIDKLKEIENIRRQQLNKAMQEEKVLTKLKDKKEHAYLHDVLKEENAFIDEIAILRGNQKRGES